jgi:hypothetical protein
MIRISTHSTLNHAHPLPEPMTPGQRDWLATLTPSQRQRFAWLSAPKRSQLLAPTPPGLTLTGSWTARRRLLRARAIVVAPSARRRPRSGAF